MMLLQGKKRPREEDDEEKESSQKKPRLATDYEEAVSLLDAATPPTPSDYVKAFECLHRAADNGEYEALPRLARFYQYGFRVVQIDWRQAYKLAEAGLAAGVAGSTTILYECLSQGLGCARNASYAQELLMNHRDLHDPFGAFLCSVQPPASTSQEYQNVLERAISKNDPHAMFLLAFTTTPFSTAWFARAAAFGHADAQYHYYKAAQTTPAAREAATECIKQGHPMLCYCRGMEIVQGSRAPFAVSDAHQAMMYLQTAAKQGLAGAQYALGRSLVGNRFVDKLRFQARDVADCATNLPSALKWLQLAADNSHLNAHRDLESLRAAVAVAQVTTLSASLPLVYRGGGGTALRHPAQPRLTR